MITSESGGILWHTLATRAVKPVAFAHEALNRKGFVYVVRGTDAEGTWFLGPGERKTGHISSAVHMASFDVAGKLAAKHGGEVIITDA